MLVTLLPIVTFARLAGLYKLNQPESSAVPDFIGFF